jgi:hypothetical protein
MCYIYYNTLIQLHVVIVFNFYVGIINSHFKFQSTYKGGRMKLSFGGIRLL